MVMRLVNGTWLISTRVSTLNLLPDLPSTILFEASIWQEDHVLVTGFHAEESERKQLQDAIRVLPACRKKSSTLQANYWLLRSLSCKKVNLTWLHPRYRVYVAVPGLIPRPLLLRYFSPQLQEIIWVRKAWVGCQLNVQ